MSDVDDFTARIISEFRANGGRVGDSFSDAPLLLLHSLGARSGHPRITPVMYMADGDRFIVFASRGGAPTNPGWYHNLRAHPDAMIEVGSDSVEVTAREVAGPERDALFRRHAARYPAFDEYQTKTTRVIPAVALLPKGTR